MTDKPKKNYSEARRNALRHNEKHILYSDEELAEVEKRASELNMRVGTYIRKISVKGQIIVYNVESVNEMRLEISRVGNNINQIVHLANETQTVTNKDIERLKRNLSEIKSLMNNWLDFLNGE